MGEFRLAKTLVVHVAFARESSEYYYCHCQGRKNPRIDIISLVASAISKRNSVLQFTNMRKCKDIPTVFMNEYVLNPAAS
jgi:hypothetical protein